ncbi:MAG: hypothetical protein JNM48_11425 [Rhodospirillales bacterium]|nr:hypothetical protein [Rhodospirillales bacterium]
MLISEANDPAIVAAEAAKRAERRLLSLPSSSFMDELTSSFADAEAAWEAADEAFADAVPVTIEGALRKMREVLALLDEGRVESLERRHVRAVVVYLEQLVFQPRM